MNKLNNNKCWVCSKLKLFIDWFFSQSLPNAIVSAIVGSLFGLLTAFFWNQYQASLEHKFFAIGEDTGIARPALLFDNAIKEGYKIKFVPPELKQIEVCEYNHLRGRTWEELTFRYFEEYEECFMIRKIGKKSIEIRPNKYSGFLRYDKTQQKWVCKCP